MSRDVPTLDARGSCHCSRHEPGFAPLEKGDDGNMGPSGPVDVWRHLELPFCLLDFVMCGYRGSGGARWSGLSHNEPYVVELPASLSVCATDLSW